MVLRFRQPGAQRHEAILFRLLDGTAAPDLFDGRLTPSQVTSIGQDNGCNRMSLAARSGWLLLLHTTSCRL